MSVISGNPNGTYTQETPLAGLLGTPTASLTDAGDDATSAPPTVAHDAHPAPPLTEADFADVDAEFAPMFGRIRAQLPKVQHYLVFDGETPDDMIDADAAIAAAG